MNNNDIEEDMKKLDKFCKYEDSIVLIDDALFDLQYAIENVVADREIQATNYEILRLGVSDIARKLDLEEDATIEEIYATIKQLQAKANKYDSLVEKIKEKIKKLKETRKTKYDLAYGVKFISREQQDIDKQIEVLQELLDTEK